MFIMQRDYKTLEVLCKSNNGIKRLINNYGKYTTSLYCDRVFLADEGPLALNEHLSVNLLNCDNIDDITLPEDTEGFILSLADKSLLTSSKCSVIRVNSRESLAEVNDLFAYNAKQLNDLFHEIAYATCEEVLIREKEKELILK